MLDCTTLLEQLAALAAQRGRLLQSEAKTWIDVSHALAEFAATDSSKPGRARSSSRSPRPQAVSFIQRKCDANSRVTS